MNNFETYLFEWLLVAFEGAVLYVRTNFGFTSSSAILLVGSLFCALISFVVLCALAFT